MVAALKSAADRIGTTVGGGSALAADITLTLLEVVSVAGAPVRSASTGNWAPLVVISCRPLVSRGLLAPATCCKGPAADKDEAYTSSRTPRARDWAAAG